MSYRSPNSTRFPPSRRAAEHIILILIKHVLHTVGIRHGISRVTMWNIWTRDRQWPINRWGSDAQISSNLILIPPRLARWCALRSFLFGIMT